LKIPGREGIARWSKAEFQEFQRKEEEAKEAERQRQREAAKQAEKQRLQEAREEARRAELRAGYRKRLKERFEEGKRRIEKRIEETNRRTAAMNDSIAPTKVKLLYDTKPPIEVEVISKDEDVRGIIAASKYDLGTVKTVDIPMTSKGPWQDGQEIRLEKRQDVEPWRDPLKLPNSMRDRERAEERNKERNQYKKSVKDQFWEGEREVEIKLQWECEKQKLRIRKGASLEETLERAGFDPEEVEIENKKRPGDRWLGGEWRKVVYKTGRKGQPRRWDYRLIAFEFKRGELKGH
jgi:hypothetical protein